MREREGLGWKKFKNPMKADRRISEEWKESKTEDCTAISKRFIHPNRLGNWFTIPLAKMDETIIYISFPFQVKWSYKFKTRVCNEELYILNRLKNYSTWTLSHLQYVCEPVHACTSNYCILLHKMQDIKWLRNSNKQEK